MFRSLISMVKSRQISHESTATVHLEECEPSSVASRHRSDSDNTHPESTIINILQGEPVSEPSGSIMQEPVADCKLIGQEASPGEDGSNTGYCEGEQPEISAQHHRKDVDCAIQRETENTGSCSNVPSQRNIETDVGNCPSDGIGPDPLQDQTGDTTKLHCLVNDSNLLNVSGEVGLVAGISLPYLEREGKCLEANVNNAAIQRTTSTLSIDSLAESCRVCQQLGEEPLMELGCHCRGELAKAHHSCIQQWFNNKGSNKCEVCQHVAANIPPPTSQPKQDFWVWRINRTFGNQMREDGLGQSSNRSIRPVLLLILRRHPSITLLWLFLLIFMTYLFVDIVGSSSVGYAAMAIGFLFGVLVVLGLGTGARLIAECWHERNMRTSQRMEMPPTVDNIQVGIVTPGVH